MLDENILLNNKTGKILYHECAEGLPIIDYHCHLAIQEIAADQQFENLGQLWLAADHYKWRAMRAFGIDEELITGCANNYDKFLAFSSILPKMIGNPLYLWCALELKRYFDIDEPLCKENADEIFQRTSALIQKKHITPSYCMKISNVEVASTTEDPADDLDCHFALKTDPRFSTRILSAFRPDNAFYIERVGFESYISRLSKAAGISINSFTDLCNALEQRLLVFKDLGSMISDHGIESLRYCPVSAEQVERIFLKKMSGAELTQTEVDGYKSKLLEALGELYHKHAFVMQLHVGTYQGANWVKEKQIGVATGFDCTDDNTHIQSIGRILASLESRDKLPKTLLYPLNPCQIEPYAILAGAFCEPGIRGKVQLGAPWWFNDTVYGIKRQFESIANLYPISLSVGMLTDSRSFLSYTRHEVYRRMFCNYLGEQVERGEYWGTLAQLKEIVRGVCYENAKEYFGL